MMTDKLREAAQRALYAMESSRVFVTSREQIKQPEGEDWYDNIINDLEAALAEPEEKLLSVHRLNQWLKVSLAEQEPMLEMNPEKREWVGLTAEDMADAHNSTSGDVMMRLAGFARAIEAKLREKNG